MDTYRLFLSTFDKKICGQHKSLLVIFTFLGRIFVSAGKVDNQTEGKSTHFADDISNMVRGGINGRDALCHQWGRNKLAWRGSGFFSMCTWVIRMEGEKEQIGNLIGVGALNRLFLQVCFPLLLIVKEHLLSSIFLKLFWISPTFLRLIITITTYWLLPLFFVAAIECLNNICMY
jgi:hypothetical protein